MTLLCLSDIHGEGAGLREILAEETGVDAHRRRRRHHPPRRVRRGGGGARAAPRFGAPCARRCRQHGSRGRAPDASPRRASIYTAAGSSIGPVGFMGLGGGTPSPFGTPWELRDEEAAGFLAAGRAAYCRRPLQGPRVPRSATGYEARQELCRAARGFRRGERLPSFRRDRPVHQRHIHKSPGRTRWAAPIA